MVSELAGEGALPLPTPASHAELRRVRLQRQIHIGSLLRRGVTRSKQDFRQISSFNLLFPQFGEDRSTVLFFQSSTSRSVKFLSKMLFHPLYTVFSRSRSESSSNKVFDYPPSVAFNRSPWSRSMESVGESMSTVLISSTSVAIVVHGVDPWRARAQSSLILLDVRCLVFDKKVSHASGGLTRVEKDQIDVIQFQIFPPKTDIEHIIVAFDYTQMDRILKEERTSTTLIKSCSAVKGSAIEGEKEILVELEEQLLNMRFQSLHQNYRYISSALEYSESVSSGSGSSGQECGNTLSTLSFGTVVIGKARENCFADVHDLRLLCNWHLQWCFVNAKTDSAYFKLTEIAEWNLYNAQLATQTLLRSVKSKQTELFLLKQNFKLYHICSVVNMVHEKAYNKVLDNQISDGNMNVSKTSIVAGDSKIVFEMKQTSESVVTEAVKEDTYVEVGTLVAKENSEMISHNTEREVAGDIAMLNHGHCDNAIN
nr:T-complex protein 1 subunit delta [Ipomoea batatas]